MVRLSPSPSWKRGVPERAFLTWTFSSTGTNGEPTSQVMGESFLILDLSSLTGALDALVQTTEASHDADGDARLTDAQRIAIRAGVIQHFEFTYELCWKFMKRWLKAVAGRNDVDGISRRELFRIAAAERLIDDPPTWFDVHTARNRTSHTYDEAVAREVLKVALAFAPLATDLLSRIESRND